jgi:hypothetical protein
MNGASAKEIDGGTEINCKELAGKMEMEEVSGVC